MTKAAQGALVLGALIVVVLLTVAIWIANQSTSAKLGYTAALIAALFSGIAYLANKEQK